MINPVGSPQIPWSLFGGLNTELSGPTLPEGLSPDTQDCAFVPGNVYTRPALEKLLPTAFGAVGVTYNKAYIQPNAKPLNLFFTADGLMHVSNPLVLPLNSSTIFQSIPNQFASSVTAFGREYICVHDGDSGKDIPRSFDGTNVRRITQDGPGAPIQAADAATTTLHIVNIVPKNPVNISTAVNNAGVVTIVTTAPHGLAVSDHALITGVSVTDYNGQIIVATVPDPSSFTYNVTGTGWDAGTGGQVIPSEVTVTTVESSDLISGETIVISGNSDANYNNSTGATTAAVSVANIAIQLFPHSHSTNVGSFDIINGSVPSPSATYTGTGQQTLMFNPHTPDGAPDVFSSAPDSWNNSPMAIYGVNPDETWDGTSTPIWSSATDNWQMTCCFNLQFPAAGTYTFRITNIDGMIFGMGGGALAVSGPDNNPMATATPPQTKTAVKGFDIFGSNNTSAHYHDGPAHIFDAEVVVSVPAAGIYPAELDYARWYHDGRSVTVSWVDAMSVSHPLTTGASYATPPTWTVNKVINSNEFTFFAVYAQGTGVGGIITIGGLLSPGSHSAVVFFETDTGFLTKPSSPVTWNAAGNKRVTIDDLPIGPDNVVARWVAFTGSAGGNYFAIPVPAIDPATGQTVSTSTVVRDNVTTTASFDFSDNTLFDSIGIDITGNNLFAMTTLGLVSGVFAYSNRLVVWGDTNKIQNLWNMGFEGGVPTVGDTTHPLGWDVSANIGGSLTPGDFGFGWNITGNGVNVQRGLISQPAFEDYLHVAILAPQTQYTFTCFAYSSTANTQGNLVAEFFSPTVGSLATATIPCSTIGVGSTMASFVSADFNAQTPLPVPADTVLRIYGMGVGNAQNITIDEMMVVYTAQPTVRGQARVSYAQNPEAFDGVTGLIGIEYPETLLTCNIIRDNLYMQSDGHLLRTQDNGVGEPITWTLYTVAEQMKGLSNRCFDVGEGWGMIACESGLYAFSGGEPQKISQEIQNLWMSMNSDLWQQVWVRNDPSTKRIYIGIPLNTYTPTGTEFNALSCNKVLVLDYRELNTASMIENAPPLHISMTGKMLSSDLTRKWSVWNTPMNCADFCFIGSDPQITFGSGFGAGLAHGYGNSYILANDSQDFAQRTKFSDDDYGQIGSWNGESSLTYPQWVAAGNTGVWRPQTSYYVTYFPPSHEQEQTYQTGSGRKLFEYLEAYVVGVGNFWVLPLMDRLGNPSKRPPKARTLNTLQNYDLEWPLNVRAQRMALLFYVTPLPTS